jgi:hypothetical protein
VYVPGATVKMGVAASAMAANSRGEGQIHCRGNVNAATHTFFWGSQMPLHNSAHNSDQ